VANPLVTGSMLKCSFGIAPSVLNVLPINRVLSSSLPVANILDTKPFVNILPFGMCSSLANPAVTAATSAALGVLTPMPCTPVTATPWVSPSRTLVGGSPIATTSAKCFCTFGGAISVVSTPAMRVKAK